jgi:hypothetical protein
MTSEEKVLSFAEMPDFGKKIAIRFGESSYHHVTPIMTLHLPGILDYHHQQGELRVIIRSTKLLMKEWSKKEEDHVDLLKTVCNDFSKIPASFPSYIRGLLTSPRNLIPSIDKDISDEMIKKVVKDTIEEILEELTSPNWTIDYVPYRVAVPSFAEIKDGETAEEALLKQGQRNISHEYSLNIKVIS